MRRMLIPVVGAACLGLASLAVAQPAPAPGADNGGPPAAGSEAPSSPPMHGPRGPGGPGGRMMMMGPHHRPPPPGASFRLRRGDTSIAIQCSERESMQACVNAASAMLDKMNSTLR